MSVVVTRSPLRLFAYVMLAIPAVLLAVDMTVSHRYYPAPSTVEVTVGSTVDQFGEVVPVTARRLTDEGQSQQRRDRLLAAMLFVGGVGAIGWAMRELVRPRALLTADRDGIAVRIDGSSEPLRRFPWSAVAEVRSGLADVDGDEVPVLSIRFHDPALVPPWPASAVADPPWLHLIGDDWSPPPHLVTPLLEHAGSRNAEEDGG